VGNYILLTTIDSYPQFGHSQRKYLPGDSVAGYFRGNVVEPKLWAAVSRQEAGERTEVRGSAQKGGNRLDCPVERVFINGR